MQSIIKQFVTFEQACDLVELGFKEDCLSIFLEGELCCIEDEYCLGYYPYQCNNDPKNTFIAPTYQQAFDFIYDKYRIVYQLHSSRLWPQQLTPILKDLKNNQTINH